MYIPADTEEERRRRENKEERRVPDCLVIVWFFQNLQYLKSVHTGEIIVKQVTIKMSKWNYVYKLKLEI